MGIFRKVSGWYFTHKALPYWCILVLDCAIVGVSGYIGYYFNLGGIGFASSFWPITWALLIGEFFFVTVFKLFHTYSGVIRYSSFVDLQRVATATIIATAGFYIAGILADLIWPGQRAVLFPDFITVLALFVISTLVLWVENSRQASPRRVPHRQCQADRHLRYPGRRNQPCQEHYLGEGQEVRPPFIHHRRSGHEGRLHDGQAGLLQ